jgi:ATP-dependent protease ClpP protease subunit
LRRHNLDASLALADTVDVIAAPVHVIVHGMLRGRQTARLREIIVRTTGRTEQEIDNDLRRGRVLSAEEALEYDLLDRLLRGVPRIRRCLCRPYAPSRAR